jgi:hypothetical protein
MGHYVRVRGCACRSGVISRKEQEVMKRMLMVVILLDAIHPNER